MAKIVFELNLDDEAETLLQAATRVAHNAMALAQSVQSDIALPQNDEQVVSHETFLHEHNMIVLMEAGPRANIGDNIPQMAFAIIPAEPKQHPSFVPGKGVALVFEASKEDSASPEEAKIAVRMGFVSDEFGTSQWRALKADPCNVAVIRDGKLGG